MSVILERRTRIILTRPKMLSRYRAIVVTSQHNKPRAPGCVNKPVAQSAAQRGKGRVNVELLTLISSQHNTSNGRVPAYFPRTMANGPFSPSVLVLCVSRKVSKTNALPPSYVSSKVHWLL